MLPDFPSDAGLLTLMVFIVLTVASLCPSSGLDQDKGVPSNCMFLGMLLGGANLSCPLARHLLGFGENGGHDQQ